MQHLLGKRLNIYHLSISPLASVVQVGSCVLSGGSGELRFLSLCLIHIFGHMLFFMQAVWGQFFFTQPLTF